MNCLLHIRYHWTCTDSLTLPYHIVDCSSFSYILDHNRIKVLWRISFYDFRSGARWIGVMVILAMASGADRGCHWYRMSTFHATIYLYIYSLNFTFFFKLGLLISLMVAIVLRLEPSHMMWNIDEQRWNMFTEKRYNRLLVSDLVRPKRRRLYSNWPSTK